MWGSGPPTPNPSFFCFCFTFFWRGGGLICFQFLFFKEIVSCNCRVFCCLLVGVLILFSIHPKTPTFTVFVSASCFFISNHLPSKPFVLIFSVSSLPKKTFLVVIFYCIPFWTNIVLLLAQFICYCWCCCYFILVACCFILKRLFCPTWGMQHEYVSFKNLCLKTCQQLFFGYSLEVLSCVFSENTTRAVFWLVVKQNYFGQFLLVRKRPKLLVVLRKFRPN